MGQPAPLAHFGLFDWQSNDDDRALGTLASRGSGQAGGRRGQMD